MTRPASQEVWLFHHNCTWDPQIFASFLALLRPRLQPAIEVCTDKVATGPSIPPLDIRNTDTCCETGFASAERGGPGPAHHRAGNLRLPRREGGLPRCFRLVAGWWSPGAPAGRKLGHGVPVSCRSEARPLGPCKVWPALTWKCLAEEAAYPRASALQGSLVVARTCVGPAFLLAGGVAWHRLFPGSPSGSAPPATLRRT